MLTFHVLTDFSAASANALRYAVVLARHTGGRIRLWHVWPETAGTARRYFTAPGLTTPARPATADRTGSGNKPARGMHGQPARNPTPHVTLPGSRPPIKCW